MNVVFAPLALALGLAVSGTVASAQAKPAAEELLKEADRARGAADDGIAWDIDVHTVEETKDSTVSYSVKVKGVDALAEATAPAKNKGEMMLFNDRNLWFFKPGLKKPVAISARQKLMGQAANGDIASTNYVRDYEGKIVGEEKVNGVDTWKLELKAKAKNVTYDGIRYWIDKAQKLGVKAEFLTVSGEVFKRAAFEYKNKMTAGGKDFPFVSKMSITDALNDKNLTTIVYASPRPEKVADSVFNVNNLVR